MDDEQVRDLLAETRANIDYVIRDDLIYLVDGADRSRYDLGSPELRAILDQVLDRIMAGMESDIRKVTA